ATARWPRPGALGDNGAPPPPRPHMHFLLLSVACSVLVSVLLKLAPRRGLDVGQIDRKSTRLNSSHVKISYAVFCLKKKKPRPPAADPSNRTAHTQTDATRPNQRARRSLLSAWMPSPRSRHSWPVRQSHPLCPAPAR